MEFYIASQGEKLGPFSIYRVVEMLREESVSMTDLAWSREQGEWLPLEKIKAFESAIRTLEGDESEEELGSEVTLDDMRDFAKQRVAERNQGKTRVVQQVQPFTRFWARMLDYALVMIVIMASVDLPPLPESTSFSEAFAKSKELAESEPFQKLAQMLTIGLWSWTLLEGILIWLFGTTPGKAVFGIRITQRDGSPVPVLRAVNRSIFTFILGFGMGLGLLSNIAMAFGFFRLLSTGQTPWDRRFQLTTHHSPVSFVRIFLAIGVILVLIAVL